MSVWGMNSRPGRRAGRLMASSLLSCAAAAAVLGALIGGAAAVGSDAMAQPTTSGTTSTTLMGSTTTTTVASSTTSVSSPSSSTSTTVPATTTTTSVSGQQLLSSVMDAFASQRAVYWTYRLRAFGGSLEQVVHDGVQDGTMATTLKSGGQVAHVSVVLDGKVYFDGNALGLDQLQNFVVPAAEKEAGKWIAVPRTSPYFAAYAINLTIGSAVEELYLGGSVKVLPPTTLDGRSVLVLSESITSKGSRITETIYVKASGLALPLEVVLAVNGVSGTIVYGPWGKPPAAKVPLKSTAIRASWVTKS
jgi:hypothetical protein